MATVLQRQQDWKKYSETKDPAVRAINIEYADLVKSLLGAWAFIRV